MSKYVRCEHCERVFEEEDIKILKEYHNEFPFEAYEEFAVCPYCGDDDLEKISEEEAEAILYGYELEEEEEDDE